MSRTREPTWAEVFSFVADHPAGATLEEIAEVLGGVSRERVRQIERDALRKFAAAGVDAGLFVRTRGGRVTGPAFDHASGFDFPECEGGDR